MISKQLRSKGSGEKIGEDGKRQGEGQSEGEGQEKGQVQDKETIFYGDNIPLDLFWFVCNDGKVLPLVDELCLMFVSVLAFAFVVFLAVAANDYVFRRGKQCFPRCSHSTTPSRCYIDKWEIARVGI